MKKAIVAGALIALAGGCLKTGGDGPGLSESEVASYALTSAVAFEGGTVIQSPIAEPTEPDAVIVPIAGSMILAPGLTQIVALDTTTPADDPVVSTLVQFGNVRRHIAVSARRVVESTASHRDPGVDTPGTDIGGGTGGDPFAGGTGGDVFVGGTGGDPFAGGTGGDPFAGGTGGDPFAGGTGGDPFAGGTGGDAFADGPFPNEPTAPEPYAHTAPPTHTVLEGSYTLDDSVCNTFSATRIPIDVTFAPRLVSGRVGQHTMVTVELDCSGAGGRGVTSGEQSGVTAGGAGGAQDTVGAGGGSGSGTAGAAATPAMSGTGGAGGF